MAVFEPQTREAGSSSGWDRFGSLDMSAMAPRGPAESDPDFVGPVQKSYLGQKLDEKFDPGNQGFYGEHKGLDFRQDEEGLYQKGKYTGPGLGDAWSSIKDAGGRIGSSIMDAGGEIRDAGGRMGSYFGKTEKEKEQGHFNKPEVSQDTTVTQTVKPETIAGKTVTTPQDEGGPPKADEEETNRPYEELRDIYEQDQSQFWNFSKSEQDMYRDTFKKVQAYEYQPMTYNTSADAQAALNAHQQAMKLKQRDWEWDEHMTSIDTQRRALKDAEGATTSLTPGVTATRYQ